MSGRVRGDIRVTVLHPVPVPQAPRRPDGSPTLGWANAETPVTIRHVPLRALGTAEIRTSDQPGTKPFRYARHAGRLWTPLSRTDAPATWGEGGEDWLARLPLPVLAHVLHADAARRFDTGHAAGLLSRGPEAVAIPLAVRRVQGLPGTIAPPRPGRETLLDLTGRCRAAVTDFAASSLIHDGEVLYRALPRAVLSTGCARCIGLPGRVPHPVDPGFPHEEVEAYVAWLGERAPGRVAQTWSGHKLREIAAELGALYDAPDPVGHAVAYANAAAPYVAEAARHVVRRGGGTAAEARRRLTAFWPTLAASTVAAIGPDEAEAALGRIRALAEYVAAEHPTAARREHMAGVVRIIDGVVRPRLAAAAPVPEDDAEAIAGLSR